MSEPFKVNTTIDWNGPQFGAEFDRLITKSLTKSAILVQNATVKNLNFQVYSVPIPTTQSGRPKWKRSGFLKGSITRVIEKTRAIVGSGMEYALWVEKGTRKTKARPYLLPALLLNKGKINQIFKRTLKESKYIDRI